MSLVVSGVLSALPLAVALPGRGSVRDAGSLSPAVVRIAPRQGAPRFTLFSRQWWQTTRWTTSGRAIHAIDGARRSVGRTVDELRDLILEDAQATGGNEINGIIGGCQGMSAAVLQLRDRLFEEIATPRMPLDAVADLARQTVRFARAVLPLALQRARVVRNLGPETGTVSKEVLAEFFRLPGRVDTIVAEGHGIAEGPWFRQAASAVETAAAAVRIAHHSRRFCDLPAVRIDLAVITDAERIIREIRTAQEEVRQAAHRLASGRGNFPEEWRSVVDELAGSAERLSRQLNVAEEAQSLRDSLRSLSEVLSVVGPKISQVSRRLRDRWAPEFPAAMACLRDLMRAQEGLDLAAASRTVGSLQDKQKTFVRLAEAEIFEEAHVAPLKERICETREDISRVAARIRGREEIPEGLVGFFDEVDHSVSSTLDALGEGLGGLASLDRALAIRRLAFARSLVDAAGQVVAILTGIAEAKEIRGMSGVEERMLQARGIILDFDKDVLVGILQRGLAAEIPDTAIDSAMSSADRLVASIRGVCDTIDCRGVLDDPGPGPEHT